MGCTNFELLATIQGEIMTKHLAEHKYLNHFQNDVDAELDFVSKFAWLIREVVCGYLCDKECPIRKLEKGRGDLLADHMNDLTKSDINSCDALRIIDGD